MTIPLATTTISILRRTVPDGDVDGYPDEEPEYRPVQTGIRAVVSGSKRSLSAGGDTEREGSEQVLNVFRMTADPCDIQHTDRILDEGTQRVYRVEWVGQAVGFALDHTKAGLSTVEGYNP